MRLGPVGEAACRPVRDRGAVACRLAVVWLANLWLPLSSGQYEGMGRYCAVLFPFFILVSGIKWRGRYVAIIAVSALLYTLCLALVHDDSSDFLAAGSFISTPSIRRSGTSHMSATRT